MAKKNSTQRRDISSSFTILSIIIFFLIILLILVENIILKFPGVGVKAGFGALLLFSLIIILIKFPEDFLKTCSSIHFAIVLLFFILITSIFGTLILQNETEDNYLKFYEPKLYSVLDFLKVTDIFHSYHFSIVLILLCLNIFFCVLKRKPFNKKQMGFLLTHTGIVVIILGSTISSFMQVKGFLHFLVGQTFNELEITTGRDKTEKMVPLGFSIKLEDFQVEMYETEYKLFLYKKKGKKGDYRVISTFEADKGNKFSIPEGGPEVRVKEVIEDFGVCSSDKQLLIINVPDRDTSSKVCLSIGEKIDIPGYQYRVELLKFIPHFNYDMKTKQYVSLSDKPINPAIRIDVQNLENPADSHQTWLFSNMPDFGSMHGKEIFPFELVFKHEASIPVIKLNIVDEKGHSELLLIANENKPIFLKENKYLLSFHEKPEEVKDYRSTLHILEEGRVVKSQIVEVNKPLVYKGYYFYQSNYNPDNPNYSGIQVVKDSGVSIVYLGFLVLIFGLIYIFYLKPLFKEKKTGEA